MPRYLVAVSMMEWCSRGEVSISQPSKVLMTVLLDSLAPEVKIISSGSAPINLARSSRACSISFMARWPGV